MLPLVWESFPRKAEQGDLGFIKNKTKQKTHQSFAERNPRSKAQRSWKNIIILIWSMFLIAKLAVPQLGQLLMRCDWTLKVVVPAILPQGNPVTVYLCSNLLRLSKTGFSYWWHFIRTVFVTIIDLQSMVLGSDFWQELKFRGIYFKTFHLINSHHFKDEFFSSALTVQQSSIPSQTPADSSRAERGCPFDCQGHHRFKTTLFIGCV